MDSRKIANSKIYQFLDFAMRLILLNLLTLLFAFPIVTLLPSLVANADTIRQYLDGTASSIFHPFWTAFKRHFKKTLFASLIMVLGALLLINSAIYFSDNMVNGTAYLLGFYLTIVIILVIVIIFVHFPLSCIYFRDLRLKDYLRLSILFSFKDIMLSIGMVMVYAASAAISYFNIPLLIIGGISFPVFLNLLLSRKLYYHISKKYE